jgi:hypothetical protein
MRDKTKACYTCVQAARVTRNEAPKKGKARRFRKCAMTEEVHSITHTCDDHLFPPGTAQAAGVVHGLL